MGKLKIAACQINPIVGDIKANTDKIIEVVSIVKRGGASVAVFPELAISGYPPEDLLIKPSYIRQCNDELERLVNHIEGITVIVGTVEFDGTLFNSAAVIDSKKVIAFVRKEILPNYLVFDEKRYFSPGSELPKIFLKDDVPFAVTICEDAWFASGPIGKAAKYGAEVVININASPYSIAKRQERSQMLKERCVENAVPIVYVNQVGGQDELVFDGASMVCDGSGNIVSLAESFVEEVLFVEVSRSAALDLTRDQVGSRSSCIELPKSPNGDLIGRIQRLEDPFFWNVPPNAPDPSVLAQKFKSGPWVKDPFKALSESIDDDLALETYSALILGTRDYVRKNGFEEVVIGLSGGIDSSLVATIAADSLGARNVHCVAMPSRYSSTGSITDARELSKRLGIDLMEIPIEKSHQAFLEMSKEFTDAPFEGLTEENLQSRLRGVLLMALSNQRNWLVLTTGNKSELATGYSTLYGDTAGGFGVIKDLSKTMVYKLATLRNQYGAEPVIPEPVIKKPPSAELRPDQRDDQSLPPYDDLDPIVESLVELEHDTTELIEAGFDADTVIRVARLIDINEYKRRQNPPGVRVTKRAFGKDRRVPITNGYKPWKMESLS